jgi:hypothetical protein
MSEPQPTNRDRTGPEAAAPPSADPVEQPALECEDASLPPEEVHFDDGRIEHPRVGYEPSNAPLRAVLGIIALVICFACFHYWVAWEFFGGLEAHEDEEKRSHLAAELRPSPSLPAAPRLEQLDRLAGSESPNIDRRMSGNEATLDRYGPSGEEGFVRVPIDRAMDFLIGRLPVRKEQSRKKARDDKARDQGMVNAGDSNSGRMFRGRQ